MRKILIVFVFLFLVSCTLFFLFKNWIIKEVFVSTVRTLTGFETKIQGIRIDLARGAFYLEDLLLFNPTASSFKGRVFAEAPELYLEFDLPALLKKEKIHIRELRLNIDQLNIEKNKWGVSNVSLLNPVRKTPIKEKIETAGTPKNKMPFQLDRLELTLRRISYNDRSGIVPKKLAVDIHVNRQVFEDIRDAKSIVNIILMKVISTAPFGNLGIDTAAIQNQLTSTVKTVRDLGERIFKETENAVGKKILTEGEDTFGQVSTTTKEKITALWGKLKRQI